MTRRFFAVAPAMLAAICILFTSSATADIDGTYFQDFESMDPVGGTVLGDDGWLVGANVYDPAGGFLGNYFSFPAPNGSGAFSNVAVGEGGPDQGAQGVVTFSDYNNPDHGNGSGNIIESFFFREYTIGAADVGNTYRFQYDVKQGDIASLADAYVFGKIIDPNAGFATVLELRNDGTNYSTLWGTDFIDITIDASHVGMIYQNGFVNSASNFSSSGMIYDNISVSQLSAIPEPSTLGFLALGLAGIAARRRRS